MILFVKLHHDMNLPGCLQPYPKFHITKNLFEYELHELDDTDLRHGSKIHDFLLVQAYVNLVQAYHQVQHLKAEDRDKLQVMVYLQQALVLLTQTQAHLS